jgi:hypothetical protein
MDSAFSGPRATFNANEGARITEGRLRTDARVSANSDCLTGSGAETLNDPAWSESIRCSIEPVTSAMSTQLHH